MKAQISVITGDLVNSQQVDTANYIAYLNGLLAELQQAKYLQQYDIFRGDSFQVVSKPEKGLFLAVYLRIALRAVDAVHWDARLAIGLGTRQAKNTGYGSAFLNSGNALDDMAKNCYLSLKTDNQKTNRIVSDLLPMLDHVIGRLSQTEAKIVQTRMFTSTNKEAAAALQKASSTVSAALKRAAFEEIMQFITAINRIT
ncbi:hypothetical protein Z042_22180 [Chania multitudinisentens RB-25]|uniref:Uncharacterized protein n=1 Tax=Chania multitudinisentens RB-25 TaxID=1441930 RepID=W0LDU2_9GAMM|nr:hypothetical protein [Chania multitudinisentens]AHG22023.1 hypothetical protein Z042_22180 [Chania multitudinisentens RB-25]